MERPTRANFFREVRGPRLGLSGCLIVTIFASQQPERRFASSAQETSGLTNVAAIVGSDAQGKFSCDPRHDESFSFGSSKSPMAIEFVVQRTGVSMCSMGRNFLQTRMNNRHLPIPR